MTNNKGFIQLPILFIAILILAGGSFYVARNSIKQHKSAQLAAVVETNTPQNKTEGQILGEQIAQQEQKVTSAQVSEKTSTSKEPAVHKVDSKNSSQESKTQPALPNTSPVITPPSQAEVQNQPAQTQPLTSPSPTPSPTPPPPALAPTPPPATPVPQLTPTPTPAPALSSVVFSLTSVTPPEYNNVALGSTGVILATFNFNVATQPPGKSALIRNVTARLIGGANTDIPISLYINNPTNCSGTGYLHTSEISTIDANWIKQGDVQSLALLFMSSIPTNVSLAGNSFKIRIEAVGVIDPETGNSITVSGLPFESNTITLIDTKPHITFSFNGSPSNTYTGGVGSTVNMSWQVQSYGGATCTASGDLSSWSGQKPAGGSQILTLDYPTGTFAYTLTCANNATADTNSATASVTVTP